MYVRTVCGVFMCLCMCACVLYVCMCVYACMCVLLCMYVFVYVCCVYVCMCVCAFMYVMNVCMYLCTYVCMFVFCVCECMHFLCFAPTAFDHTHACDDVQNDVTVAASHYCILEYTTMHAGSQRYLRFLLHGEFQHGDFSSVAKYHHISHVNCVLSALHFSLRSFDSVQYDHFCRGFICDSVIKSLGGSIASSPSD